MILAKKKRSIITLKINSIAIHETNNVALLGITTDNNLSFMEHIENLFRQVNFKLHPLPRIRKYLFTKKAWVLCNVFINSQFHNVPII